MALRYSLNFLPPVFRTDTNQRFLGATFDQLITESIDTPLSGYVGRTVAPTFKVGDNYLPEPTAFRKNYQLEPHVVIKDADKRVIFNSGYIDLLQNIATSGGFIDNHQRLFKTESYNYDGHFDYDKFVNYNDYFWMPSGPQPVGVSTSTTPYSASFTVTRSDAIGGYSITGTGGHANTQIALARGGRYTFVIDQPGFKFWIQSQPGVSGVDPNVSAISTRSVYGVKNNGTDSGVITFAVPTSGAQNFYLNMATAATVDAAVDFNYTDIEGKLLSEFLAFTSTGVGGLDGITNNLQNKTIIFINNSIDDILWTVGSVTVPIQQRTGTWKVTLIPNGSGDYTISLLPNLAVAVQQKVFITSGKTHASTYYWLDNNRRYSLVPLITANANYLYYQDSANPGFTGEIKLVDIDSTPIDVVNDILGKTNYTSPNGVVFTNGLKIQFDSLVVPAAYASSQYYVDGVGTSIKLIAVDQLIIPEIFNSAINTTPDYITINRTSQDQNAWSRSNRWFHKDVLAAVAKYNGTSIDYGPNLPGRRPIIEFEPDLQLFDFGTLSKNNIDIITFEATDAFNQYEGKTTASIGGVQLSTGQRIVFANDYDTFVTNKIWLVQIERINSQNFIRLIETYDDPVIPGEHMLVTQGLYLGKTFRYTGTDWNLCQEKTTLNQAPLFDLVDADGYSFSDTTVYPGNSFAGNRIFGYPVVSSGPTDTVLGFPLKYQNFNNIGDIVFENYYDTAIIDGTAANSGYIVKNAGLSSSTKLTDWVMGTEPTHQYQLFSKIYDGRVVTIDGVEQAFIQLDVLPESEYTVPYLKVYLNNTLLVKNADYIVTKYGVYDVIFLNKLPTIGDTINVALYSNIASSTGYYTVPENLDLNPLNETFGTITLGQMRKHYNQLIENTQLSDRLLQDTYIKTQGGTLMQHAAPTLYAMMFLGDQSVSFIDSANHARKEYSRFKNKFLRLCETLPTLDYADPRSGVDAILKNINAVKNASFPWYYSDMVPQGDGYSTIAYTVLNVRQTNYEISAIFNDTELSGRAVVVYLNGVQLLKNLDYTFSQISPSILLSRTVTVGDALTIREYASTDGNYIPETPTKLGLYEKFQPKIYLDTSYRPAIQVIQGHDGSITPAFGDFRDQYLLELESRIYNNIKSNYSKNQINLYDVIPGKFRTSDYSLSEWNQVLGGYFLQWVGAGQIDYSANPGFDANVSWTWNYNKFTDTTADHALLQGSWRAIYNYWFDTDTPNATPWKMLGFESQPSWWVARYGPAPYTSGNGTLWDDLAIGYVYNNGAPYTDVRFARENLLNFIPVDSAGNLLPPDAINMVYQRNLTSAANNFAVGEFGPAEIAWRRSSEFPFAVQAALALTVPAEYFATQIDTSRFSKNGITGQFSDYSNRKITPNILQVNGDTTSGAVSRTSGYINWIGDSIKNLGIDPVTKINSYFQNLSVNLAYKAAGFTDKTMLTVSAEQTSPGSTNSSVIIPDANYTARISKSAPAATVSYSAVILEKTTVGYSVTGYDLANPVFTITPSNTTGSASVMKVNTLAVKIYETSSNTTMEIPYGTTFATIQQVSDFLISYERYLVSQGFRFNQFDTELSEVRDFRLSVKEFLYWVQQGWSRGSIIVVNPGATRLALVTANTVIDEISNLPGRGTILNQNFAPIRENHFNVVRTDFPTGNSFAISTLNGEPIGFARFQLVQFETTLIFDNISDFGDIIYVPNLGSRQYRLKVSGNKTSGWSGALSAAGYMYNDPNIATWCTDQDYRRGDIVTFNSYYYTATSNVVVASQTFNSIYWNRIQKSDIKTGLLPSFATAAKNISNIYDIDAQLSNESLQAYSAALIGFRERPYLTDLGLNISTQAKFYQGYIKQKGTNNAISALTIGKFNNVNSTVSTYEEWAFRVGVYGDMDGTKYSEYVLDQSVFSSNPVAVTITDSTYNTSGAVVSLALANVYTASNLTTVSTSLYDNRTTVQYAIDLPSSGYVNTQDIDATVFELSNTTVIKDIAVGKKIWFAKNQNKKWDVARINETDLQAISLVYTLDSYAKLSFSTPHGFQTDDYFILKDFNPKFDGIYKVENIPTALSVTITLQNPKSLILTSNKTTGNGVVYKLGSVVIDSITNVDSIRPLHDWEFSDRVWVDAATTDGWGVYTFTRPWIANSSTRVTANTITPNTYFGNATAISSDLSKLYVGNPGGKSVQMFANLNYAYTTSATINNSDTGFGSAIDTQGNLLIVGAPQSANVHIYNNSGVTYTKIQTLSSANAAGKLGSSVAVSSDLHWLYVSEPVAGVVKAYWTSNVIVPNYQLVTSIPVANAVIKTNGDGSRLIIGAPGVTNTFAGAGSVYVYSRTANAFSTTQTISAQYKNINAGFGTSIAIDSMAANLFVGIPGSTVTGIATGAVERWCYNGSTYEYAQRIDGRGYDIGAFGTSVAVTGDAAVLAVGDTGSAAEEDTTFDNSTTVIDSQSTKFIEYVLNSGAVYLHDLLLDQSQVGSRGVYTFTENLPASILRGDKFGASIAITRDTILVGATGAYTASGAAYIYKNPTQQTGWELTRQQTPQVDISSISRTFIYNKVNNNILAALDYIDPAKGKILNQVAQDIDYQKTSDPAFYNAGTGAVVTDYHWGPEQIGKIWWNLDTIRFIDYEQDSLIYRLNHWGSVFPGSEYDIYEWVESLTLPSQYTGPGVPVHANNSAYSTYGYVDQGGAVRVKYYFWVMDKATMARGKNNSVISIAAAIKNPKSQGVPYLAALRNDTIALYNINRALIGASSVLHIGNRSNNAGLIHSEYALVQEGNPTSVIPAEINRKLIDSLAAQDALGNTVPDPVLTPAQKYGIDIRPRQSMFVDQTAALGNYTSLVNTYLLAYPVIERKLLTILNTEEPIPGSDTGVYDQTVDTFLDLGYLNTNYFANNHKVLVISDDGYLGKWVVYNWLGNTWQLDRVQSYKTNLYWNRVDWYAETYDPTRTPDVTVANNLELGKLTPVADTFIKVVSANNIGEFVVYYINPDLTSTLVGIQNGTIQINTSSIPKLELRQILTAMRDEIFIDDLSVVYNYLFFAMIKFALTEQKNLDWVFKTSFLTATQYIRKLEQFPSYIADNQDYFRDYINEVKPYRTVLREFVVDYQKLDNYSGDITDFDLAPYWDAASNMYRSPNGEQPGDAALLTNARYSQWANNYTYSVVDVVIDKPGQGYIFAPQILFKNSTGSGAGNLLHFLQQCLTHEV